MLIPSSSNNNNNDNDDDNSKCFFPFDFITRHQSEIEKCLKKMRMGALLRLHGFPERHEHNTTNSCLEGTTTRKSRSSAKFFSVPRESSPQKLLSNDGGEENESNESPLQSLNLLLWHRIFTFFDFVLLVKRVSSAYFVYRKFFMKSKADKFKSFNRKQSTSERSDRQMGVHSSRPESAYISENIVRANGIGIFEEKSGNPVKTILAAVTLAYLALAWGLLRNGDSLLMMILGSHKDSSSKDTTFDVLLEHDFLWSYHRLAVFDLNQAVDSLAFLQEAKNGLITLNDGSLLKKFHEHQVNTTHECLFNSCGDYTVSSSSSSTSPSPLASADPSDASFIDVMSSVVMTTASIVMAEVITGSLLWSLMVYCCPQQTTHFSRIDPRSFRTQAADDRRQIVAQADHKLLETHV